MPNALDVNASRSLLKRAVNTAVDQPERLFEAWLRFEREVVREYFVCF